MASTIEHQDEEEKTGPSMVVLLIVYLVITLIAGGAGFGVSATLLAPSSLATSGAEPKAKPANADAHGAPAKHATDDGDGTDMDEPAHKLVVVDIPSITTNLVDPSDAWIRMELSLVFEEAGDDAMAQDVHQDIIAYVHTMKLYNLRGGSGYQHLIEDLQERAAIRTEGRVKRVLVRSLILE